MTKKLDIVLHSDYAPEICLSKLAEQIDLDQSSLSSPSGYQGNKPLVGCVAGSEFRLHKGRFGERTVMSRFCLAALPPTAVAL